MARSRSGEAVAARVRSRRSLRSVPSTAATWPWGRERVISNALVRSATAVPPLSRILNPSTTTGGHFDKFREGTFTDLAGLAIGFAQQDGGRGVSVGDGLDVHGY